MAALPAPDGLAGGTAPSLPDDPAAFAAALLHMLGQGGSAAHPLLRVAAAADDVAHAVALVHGDHPDAIDIAARALDAAPSGPWLASQAQRFAIERAWLARRVAAVPALRGPGVGLVEGAARAQREALATLARSGRAGCALGAAVGLLVEWRAIRVALGGGAAPPLGDDAKAVLAQAAATAPERRAIRFGAAQVAGLNGALWDMLAARRDALP